MAETDFVNWLNEVTRILRERHGFDMDAVAEDPNAKQVVDDAWIRHRDSTREAAETIYLMLGPERPEPAK